MKKPFFPRKFPWLMALFCWASPLWAAGPAGDAGSLEPGLKTRNDILFFGGFEAQPWTSVWGMDWGPEPAANSSLVEGSGALDFGTFSSLLTQPRVMQFALRYEF